jgi:hypothetical protein
MSHCYTETNTSRKRIFLDDPCHPSRSFQPTHHVAIARSTYDFTFANSALLSSTDCLKLGDASIKLFSTFSMICCSWNQAWDPGLYSSRGRQLQPSPVRNRTRDFIEIATQSVLSYRCNIRPDYRAQEYEFTKHKHDRD